MDSRCRYQLVSVAACPGDLLYGRNKDEDSGREEVVALLEDVKHILRPLPQYAVVHHVLHQVPVSVRHLAY